MDRKHDVTKHIAKNTIDKVSRMMEGIVSINMGIFEYESKWKHRDCGNLVQNLGVPMMILLITAIIVL